MRIYFDHNATTPPHREVITIQNEATSFAWANPSSLHAEGRAARQAVELARRQVAALLCAGPQEVVFTSGGTESNNTAIMGVCRHIERSGSIKGQIISSPLEHPSVKAPLRKLTEEGWSVELLSVDSMGRLDLENLEQTLRHAKTTLVTLSLCNHELGNLYPISEVTRLSHQYGALVHCDAVQAAGRISVNVSKLPVDLLTVSSHKLYGPKGVGALFCRSSVAGEQIHPLLLGGEQERGRRAGTENVISIIGFGKACELAQQELDSRMQTTMRLRNQLEKKLLAIPGARLHGDPQGRGPGTCNIGFEGVEGELLMASLDLEGVAVSTGAACSSGSLEPSPVLLALGFTKAQALQGVRFSLGYENTGDEVEQVVNLVEKIVRRIRAVRPS